MWLTEKISEWYRNQRRFWGGTVRRFSALVATNWKVAVGVAVAVVAVLASIIGYFAWSSRQEANAAALLFKGVSQLAVKTGSAEDVKKREEAVQMMRDVTLRYPRTTAAAEATLRLGSLFYALENYEGARTVYERYLSKNPRGRIAFWAGMGMGDSLLAERKYDKAVETYLGLINQFPQDPLLPEAYLNLARTYLSMKRTQDAIGLYEKVAEMHATMGWGQNALAQLRKIRPAQ
ncbi:MAG: tetratricopeptide repeat protein [Candidatus Methylomirabilis sp.]